MSNSIGLYIHIPFCKSKCPYCDFYSISNKNEYDNYVEKLHNNWQAIVGEEDIVILPGDFCAGGFSFFASCAIMKEKITKEKMEEIQDRIAEIKAAAMAE